VTEVARRVVHIPEVLYHWRTIPGSAAADSNAKPYAAIAGRKAVQDHLDRLGIAGTVDHGPANGLYRTSRPLNPDRRVSIVIPTIGSSGLVWGATRVFVVEAVQSLLDHTEHVNLEVVIVYDEPTPSNVLDTLREVVGDRLVLVPFDEPFNYSRKMNLGVLHSTGDRLVLLNDDVAARSDKWLEELVAPLDEVDVGMTGAKLIFSNDTIQHIGHFYSGGHYLHIALSEPSSSLGEFGVLGISREVSGVTAACAGIRRDTFDQVGGFSEALPVNFNDVDLSYKVRRTDKRIVVVPHCELFHFESRTRERIVDDWERIAVQRRWGVPRIDSYVPRRRRSERVQQSERQRPIPRTTKTEIPTATA
jgi:GT2 family glycosyltransferase